MKYLENFMAMVAVTLCGVVFATMFLLMAAYICKSFGI